MTMILTKETVKEYSYWKKNVFDEGAFALVDKGKGWTSFDIIAKLRKIIKIKKIGHAGTLDPLATGLLIVAFGKATKRLSEYQDLNKSYQGLIKFGATTKTDDAEAEEENIKDISDLTYEMIEKSSKNFMGTIMQKPPKYSAKRLKGERMYVLARKNIDFEPEPKEIQIYKFNIKSYTIPLAAFEVECSKGTYIRSLARDIGESLGTGAYLASLRRNAIGEFNVNDALTVSDFIKASTKRTRKK